MSRSVDVNMWMGQFPFRRIACTTPRETARKLLSLDFGEAVVSPFEAIFQEDSFGAEEALARDLASDSGGVRFRHFKVVNPACNWWERDLRRAVDSLGVVGIRLCPTFHDYGLDAAEVAETMAVADDLDLPVQVMCKMQDWRIQWMMHTEDVEPDQVDPFLKRFGDHRLILSGLHVTDMLRLATTVNACTRLLMDTSRLKGPWRTFTTLFDQVDPGRLCFGSLWPVNLPECPLAQIAAEQIDPAVREAILADNAARLLSQRDACPES